MSWSAPPFRAVCKHKVTKNIFACAAHVVSDPGHVLKANNFLGALCLYAEEWSSLTYIYFIYTASSVASFCRFKCVRRTTNP